MTEIIMEYLEIHREFPLLVGMLIVAVYALIENIKLHKKIPPLN